MTRRMLIDGVHPEQTRVVVMDDRRLLEFDTEIASQRTLKGNIYLAKVTRVEPSLQAAFVEYGGNRHGFLPFSEIHPDYYRIPVADREALKESQRRHRSRDDDDDDDDDLDVADDDDDLDMVELNAASDDDDADDDDADDDVIDDDGADDSEDDSDDSDDDSDDDEPTGGKSSQALAANIDDPSVSPGDSASDAGEASPAAAIAADSGEAAPSSDGSGDAGETENTGDEERPRQRRGRRNGRSGSGNGRERGGRDRNNRGGDGDRDGDRRSRSRAPHRSYTIQEVLKRGQIMLIQVVKEERGTKGAAVTSYLSLAGRYCVLMPNTARGGGISRKITQGKDRKRLKDIVDSLEIQDSMAVIVRTAGIGRTKSEIKRDYDFLAKTWEQIRDTTLQSRAPVLIYEESGLIKRTLRDSYTREIEEVIVQGDAAYREAKDFMKTLMPSHAKRVQPYKDASPPLFHRFNVDVQLHRLHSPIVQLPSGGYLVINMTEALVAIDINSGRSTRERNIEETALKTNLEAADEIGRQLRLRDLAGLVVIDFIDMDDRRNNYAVERRLKDAMRTDRARVQIGRISPLGLLELSRQRLRPSLLETIMDICPVCEGLGRVASTSSSAIQALSSIEDEGMRGRASLIRVHIASAVAFYILNEKRDELARIERDYGLRCVFEPDATLIPPNLKIEVLETGQRVIDVTDATEVTEPEIIAEPEEDEAPQPRRRSRRGRDEDQEEASEGQESGRRRRGRRSGRRRDEAETVEAETADAPSQQPDSADSEADDSANSGRSRGRRRRRRGRGRSEGRSGLPGVAVFARSATPLAWHVAAEDQESPPAANGHDTSTPVDVAQPPESADAPPLDPSEQPPAPEAAAGSAADETVADMLMPVAQAMDKAPSGRRPRRRRRSSEQQDQAAASDTAASTEAEQPEAAAEAATPEASPDTPAQLETAAQPEPAVQPETPPAPEPEPEAASEPEATQAAETEASATESGAAQGEDEGPSEPEATPVEAAEPAAQPEPPAAPEPEPGPPRPRRKGWWQRLLD